MGVVAGAILETAAIVTIQLLLTSTSAMVRRAPTKVSRCTRASVRISLNLPGQGAGSRHRNAPGRQPAVGGDEKRPRGNYAGHRVHTGGSREGLRRKCRKAARAAAAEAPPQDDKAFTNHHARHEGGREAAR